MCPPCLISEDSEQQRYSFNKASTNIVPCKATPPRPPSTIGDISYYINIAPCLLPESMYELQYVAFLSCTRTCIKTRTTSVIILKGILSKYNR